MDEQKAPAIPVVKFKLSKPHTHAGEDYKPNDTIELRKPQAERLQAAEVGKIVNG